MKYFIYALTITLGMLAFSNDANSSTKKGQTVYVKKKEYKVPGSVVISAAARHGYIFKNRPSKGYRRKGCQFVGNHWQVGSKYKCVISGFVAPRAKDTTCRVLRKGWKVKEIKLKGSYVWKLRRENSAAPKFMVESNNTASKTKNVSIDTITLTGPEGPFKDFEKAFSHCSQLGYRH